MKPLFLMPFLILNCSAVLAIEIQPSEALIQIKGTAVNPPCEINNNEEIIVDFGSSSINKAKQGHVLLNNSIFISCDTNTPFSLVISGTTAENKHSLLTNIPGLNIAHFRGGALNLNEPFSVKNNSFLELETRLEVSEDVALQEAEFTAQSALKVIYQ